MYITNLLENTFPKNTGESTEEQLQTIRNYLYQLNEQLRYIFNNLEAENFNETELEKMKKEFLAPIETVVKDLEGNLTSIKQGFDKIESTVKDMDGKVSRVTQTVDGIMIETDEGETSINGAMIKTGIIDGADFRCVLRKDKDGNDKMVGAYGFFDERNGPNDKYVGMLTIDGDGRYIKLHTNENETWKIRIESYGNIALASHDNNVYLQAPNGQIILSAGSGVRIASPAGTQYVFRDDGIYYGTRRIVDNTKTV